MGMFDIFKRSKLSTVIKEMRKKDLAHQAILLKSGSKSGYTFDILETNMNDFRIKGEIALLRFQNVNIKTAMLDQERFTQAKEICENHDFLFGARFLENYIRVYKLYIKQLQDDTSGGPKYSSDVSIDEQ